MNLAVFGATGRTGRHVLEQGVRRGHQLTAFTRRPADLAGVPGLRAVVAGDGLQFSDVLPAVRGQDGIIAMLSSPGLGPSTVVSEVTRNIIAAMQETGVRRLVCVSSHSLVATRPWLIMKLVKWIFHNPYADLAAMAQAIRTSPLEWTMVRATQLTDGPATGQVRCVQGEFDTGPYRISRADLATVLLDVVERPDVIRSALEVSGARHR